MTMMTVLISVLDVLLLLTWIATPSTAWTSPALNQRLKQSATTLSSSCNSNNDNDKTSITTTRRNLLQKSIQIGASSPVTVAASASAIAILTATNHPDPAYADSAYAARTQEKKCDPGDARCRQGGEIGELPSGQPIPAVTNRITYVVQMIVDVGERRENDAGYLRFGLYGEDCPASVKQMLLFLTRGITSMDKQAFENSLEIDYAPVSLEDGGSVQNVCSELGVDFGVPSQSRAYARGRGMRSAGPNFVPQGRPAPAPEGEAFPRHHGVAGLVSVPAKGIGYGGGAINSELAEDEIYSSAFTITAGAVAALDKPNTPQRQRVIGQIIDDESMQFLDRLANLPVQKKLGKSGSGPPLLKVRVRAVDVQKV